MRSLRRRTLAPFLVACSLIGSASLAAASTSPAVATPAATRPSACDMPAGTAEGRPDPTYRIRPIGTVRAVMLFVDFPDAVASGSTDDYADALLPARAWFRRSSFHKLTLRIDTVDQWFRMPHDTTDYDFQRGLSFAAHKRYLADAIHAANAAVDFSPYDIVYVVPPSNAAAISFSPAFIAGPNGVRADGHILGFGATFGQDMWSWGFKVLDHETGHIFGLPDLYAYKASGDYWTDHRFVGGWDMMGFISTPSPDYFAWHKWHLGWVGDAAVRCLKNRGAITVTLSPVEVAGGIKLAIIKVNQRTAYAVEVRSRAGNDAEMCQPGVLIYRVLGSVESGAGPLRVARAHTDDVDMANDCLLYYAATFRVGESFENAAVKIRVVGSDSGGYKVKLVRK